jgi:glucuronate isomerase
VGWARTVPKTLRNVAYQWTHLELLRYFGIDYLLDEATAPKVWGHANEQLRIDELSARGILKKFRVKALCTTDDPTDSLESRQKIRKSNLGTLVFPTFRPDKALKTEEPARFNAWTDKLAAAADLDIVRFSDFLHALERHQHAFHECGCRLSDHGLNYCYADPCTEGEAGTIFNAARAGKLVAPSESVKLRVT